MKGTDLPLEGLKVIEFCWLFAGPVTGKFLADHGAEVIKIESPRKPDDVRAYGPHKDGISGMNRGYMFAGLNTSKLGMTVDLKNPRGLELARRLVARADVVVESFSPGTLEGLGLGYETMVGIKPDIILASINMQGSNGPHAKQPMFGTQLQGGAGFCHLAGWPDRPPTPLPTPFTDFVHPWFVLSAILGALDHRERTGKGQHIDASQLEVSLHFLALPLLEYTANKHIAFRHGNRNPNAVPHGVFPTRGEDRWCAIAVTSDYEWEMCCRAMGQPGWSRDPRFNTFAGRKEHEDELERLIAAWTLEVSPEEAMSRLQLAGVPAGVVQNGMDLLARDPQLQYREHCSLLEHPEMGIQLTERAPFRLSATPCFPRWHAPCLGEHNEHVCKEVLGVSDEEFLDLYQVGAFG